MWKLTIAELDDDISETKKIILKETLFGYGLTNWPSHEKLYKRNHTNDWRENISLNNTVIMTIL